MIVARRDDGTGGDARQLRRALPFEPAIEVVPETDGQLRGRGERRGDDVILAQLSLEGVEQLRLLGLLVPPFRRHDPVVFEVDEAGQVALARAEILFLGDPGAVAAADDSDVDVGAVYLIERCALSGLRAAAEIFHADELSRVHAVDSVFHGMALGLQINPRRADENACDGWEHLTPPCLARLAESARLSSPKGERLGTTFYQTLIATSVAVENLSQRAASVNDFVRQVRYNGSSRRVLA